MIPAEAIRTSPFQPLRDRAQVIPPMIEHLTRATASPALVAVAALASSLLLAVEAVARGLAG